MREVVCSAIKFLTSRASVIAFLSIFVMAHPLMTARAAEPEVAAKAAVLMEMRSGKILWARNKDVPVAPASTAKILTALVVLEHSHPSDMLTVPVAATLAKGATAQLEGGERITVRQLLYALLIHSGNDAALTLAAHVGGSLSKFAQLMNQKARSLGALQSNFLNPTGLPERGQVTTARDLAVITRAALRNPAFSRIVATNSHPWKSAKWQGELKNSNKLLESYRGAIGVKTGNTAEAGYCLVAAARRGSETYIAVLLHGQEKSVWQDATNLLNYGFKNFTSMSLIDRGETIVTSVVNGARVPLAAADAAHYFASFDDLAFPQIQIALEELQPPIAKGEKLGEAVLRDGDKEIARVDLVSKVTVPDQLQLIWVVALVSLLLLTLFLVYRRLQRRRNRYIFADRSKRLRFR